MSTFIPLTGSKSPYPLFTNTAGNPNVMNPRRLSGAANPFPRFVASNIGTTQSVLNMVPVKPLPGSGGSGGGGTVGYPI